MSFGKLKFRLQEGRLPQNKSEVVISNHIISNAGLKLKLGSKLSLEIGERKTLDGYDLYPSNPYLPEEGEQIINKTKYEFTIVRNNGKTRL